MNLHEYQAKQLFREYGLPVSNGFAVDTGEQAAAATEKIGGSRWVVKAQVHAGGRGKAGGVQLVDSGQEAKAFADKWLGQNLVTYQTDASGQPVNKILVEECVSIERELYLGAVIDRTTRRIVFMASTEGGVEIETVAEETPEKIIKEWVDPSVGLQGYQVRKIAFGLGLSGNAFKEMTKFIYSLYNAYDKIDASMFEINPVLKTSDDQILAVDAKVNIDDNALFRQKTIEDLRDLTEEDPSEIEANKSNLSYVKLDGNVGCMVNGAGLAMATMDIIKLSGGDPANFLDVGGTASAETVEAGFRIILKDPNVKAILLNIFGGIVRCDRVANGVVQAYKNIGEISVPIVVRLQGTNSEEGAKIIKESGLEVFSTNTLQDAADKINEILKK